MKLSKIIIFLSWLLIITNHVNAYNDDNFYNLPEIEINLDLINDPVAEQPRILRFPEYQTLHNTPKIKLIPPEGVKDLEIKPSKPIITPKPLPIKKPKPTPIKETVIPEEPIIEKTQIEPSPEFSTETPVSDVRPVSLIPKTYTPVEEEIPFSKPEKTDAPETTASLPQPVTELILNPPPKIEDGLYELSLIFEKESSAVSEEAHQKIKNLANSIKNEEDLSLRLMSYAQGEENASSRARRLSLSRALAVRSKLMDYGIRSTRIEVRALGNALENNEQQDRIDLYKIKR